MPSSIALLDYSGSAGFRRRGEVYPADGYDSIRYQRGLAMEDLRGFGVDLHDCMELGDMGIRTAAALDAFALAKLPPKIRAKLERTRPEPEPEEESEPTDLRQIPRIGQAAEAALIKAGILDQQTLREMPPEYAEDAIEDLTPSARNAIARWRAGNESE